MSSIRDRKKKDERLQNEAEEAIEVARQRLKQEMDKYEEKMARRRARITESQPSATTPPSAIRPVTSAVGSTRLPTANTSTIQAREIGRPQLPATPAVATMPKDNNESSIEFKSIINDNPHGATEGLDVVRQLADCFANSISNSKLPAPDITKFTGNALEFHVWEFSFNSLLIVRRKRTD